MQKTRAGFVGANATGGPVPGGAPASLQPGKPISLAVKLKNCREKLAAGGGKDLSSILDSWDNWQLFYD